MSDENKEMKYEGLAALIVTNQNSINQRLDDIKDFSKQRFNTLEEYNKRQNGKVSKLSEKVSCIERKQVEMKDCSERIEKLERQTTYLRLIRWIDRHPKLSVGLLVAGMIIVEVIVKVALYYIGVLETISIFSG